MSSSAQLTSPHHLLLQRKQADKQSVLVFTVAAEVAAARPDVKGPGTFRAALLDELYLLKPEALLRMAKIEID